MKRLKVFIFLITTSSSVLARHALIEFKGSYFLPTSNVFKKIYKGNALYAPELTIQLLDKKNWYLFSSFDYIKTTGHSIGLHNPTTLRMYPFAAGVKYFFSKLQEKLDFYTGLGFQAVHVKTNDCVSSNSTTLSKWGFGGILKFGIYWYLPGNFLLDFFVDYSFIKAGLTEHYYPETGLQPRRSALQGAIFGIGIGYRF